MHLLALLACGGSPSTSVATDELRPPEPPPPAPTPAAEAPPAPPPAPAGPPPRAPAPTDGVRTVVDLQRWRAEHVADGVDAKGRPVRLELVDLAPTVHVWLLLEVAREGAPAEVWHLENPRGSAAPVTLAADGLRVAGGAPCAPWADGALAEARASGRVYAPICGGSLTVRNPAEGSKTALEWSTDFLRDHVVGGESVTRWVKEWGLGPTTRVEAPVGGEAAPRGDATGPEPARVADATRGRTLDPVELGVRVVAPDPHALEIGAWYPVDGVPAVFVSAYAPAHVPPDVIAAAGDRLNPLGSAESSALVLSIAFDLSAFDLAFEIGTEHPRVDWGQMLRPGMRDPSLPGPDGVGDLAPLVRTGLVPPAQLPAEVAVFVGGFKRTHGVLHEGPLAEARHGRHYGFVQHGVTLSTLQPDLATFAIWNDGRVELRDWTEADADREWALRHARQNGVLVVEPGPEGPRAGAWVNDWKEGNWGGSVEGRLRSIRAGLCLQDGPRGRWLVYGWFSEATPSAMAAVFLAYGCDTAMLLDMNALEHTYLALDVVRDGAVSVEHLSTGMAVLDKVKGRRTYQRFVGYADNRDFFTVLRR